MKALYYGDNLQVLRDSVATESVDLIYLDPPFNSKATYNVRYWRVSRHLAEWALISAYSHMLTYSNDMERAMSWLRSAVSSSLGCPSDY